MRAVKTTVVILGLITVASVPVSAQVMSMGIKGGVNRSSVGAEVAGTSVETGQRTKYHGAALVNWAFNETFALQFEMGIVGKGFEPDESGSGTGADLSLTYFQLPVLAMITIPVRDSPLSPRVFAGPAFGFRAGCNLTPEMADPTQFTDCDADVSKSVDLGVIVGVGLKIGRGDGGFTVDVAYDYGFTNISKANGDVSVKNRNLMLSLGFVFPII